VKVFSELRKTKFRVVGASEVIKVLNTGAAREVFVAKDAERSVIKPILELCEEKKIEVLQVESMKELGSACGIRVGAASAALLKKGRQRKR
jgi:large subunit ribosomal protein L7A